MTTDMDPKKLTNKQQQIAATYWDYAHALLIKSLGVMRANTDMVYEDIYYDVFIDHYMDAVKKYDPSRPFKPWFRSRLVLIRFDYYHRTKKYQAFYWMGDGFDTADPDNNRRLIEQMQQVIHTQLTDQEQYILDVFTRSGLKYSTTMKRLGFTGKKIHDKRIIDELLERIKQGVEKCP